MPLPFSIPGSEDQDNVAAAAPNFANSSVLDLIQRLLEARRRAEANPPANPAPNGAVIGLMRPPVR
jgi:hypothetical protein